MEAPESDSLERLLKDLDIASKRTCKDASCDGCFWSFRGVCAACDANVVAKRAAKRIRTLMKEEK